jgi:hypothetical protein
VEAMRLEEEDLDEDGGHDSEEEEEEEGHEEGCDTPIKMIRANNVLKYQSLDQLLVQYII